MLISFSFKKAAALSGGGPGNLATLPPDMQADHLRKVVKSCKLYSKMTDLELDEIGIRGGCDLLRSGDRDLTHGICFFLF